ncbi:MAG: hypothetical protein ACXWNC_00470 [Anaerolineales bacterium]
MTSRKVDGIIEAVRYTPGGKIAVVRMYERHGVVWSDRILIGRQELSERLKHGKRFVIGERKTYLGSMFDTGTPVHQLDDLIITEGQAGGRDLLSGVPIF